MYYRLYIVFVAIYIAVIVGMIYDSFILTELVLAAFFVRIRC